jgi:hypothetical protein
MLTAAIHACDLNNPEVKRKEKKKKPKKIRRSRSSLATL